jgi:predicted nucleic acid-binding protein
MLFDTNFIIALSGQRGKNVKARAQAFLQGLHPAQNLYTSRICWMEFAAGCETIAVTEETAKNFAVLGIDEALAWNASRMARMLKQQGQIIGDHDVWIAATAHGYGLTLVTNNTRHFARIPGLKLQSF